MRKREPLGGIRTATELAQLMSTVMGNVLSGRVTPADANATCNTAGKLLKAVETQARLGRVQRRVQRGAGD